MKRRYVVACGGGLRIFVGGWLLILFFVVWCGVAQQIGVNVASAVVVIAAVLLSWWVLIISINNKYNFFKHFHTCCCEKISSAVTTITSQAS